MTRQWRLTKLLGFVVSEEVVGVALFKGFEDVERETEVATEHVVGLASLFGNDRVDELGEQASHRLSLVAVTRWMAPGPLEDGVGPVNECSLDVIHRPGCGGASPTRVRPG